MSHELKLKMPTESNRVMKEQNDRLVKRYRIQQIISIVIVAIDVLLLSIIFSKIIGIYQVPTGSMNPTIKENQFVISLKVGIDNLERGDIVVYQDEDGINYVKRVIGTSGDVIEFKDNSVYVNGILLEEDYLSSDVITESDISTFEVPEGSIFVLGDNREDSHDSRYMDDPYISVSQVQGRVWFPVGISNFNFYL